MPRGYSPSTMPPMIESLAGKRVALVHHWLLSMRGGERVLEAIAGLVPDAPIYTAQRCAPQT